MSRFRDTPIADAIARAGAKERNPSYGELWMAAGRSERRLADAEAKVRRLEFEATLTRALVTDFVQGHPREAVELLEAAGHLEPYGPPAAAAFRLVGVGNGELPPGLAPALGRVLNEIDVVDAEVIE